MEHSITRNCQLISNFRYAKSFDSIVLASSHKNSVRETSQQGSPLDRRELALESQCPEADIEVQCSSVKDATTFSSKRELSLGSESFFQFGFDQLGSFAAFAVP